MGYLNNPLSVVYGLHHLAYGETGSTTALRTDVMTRALTIDESGVFTLADESVAEYPLMHFGMEYDCEVETLDIDDIQNPVTGLPMTIGDMLLRFGMANSFSIGRTRTTLTEYDDLTDEGSWDGQLLTYEGVFSSLVEPGWGRHGRVVVKNRDGFPFQLLAITPMVEIGDLDA